MNTLETLEAHVRELVREDGFDPMTDKSRLHELVSSTIEQYERMAILGKVMPLTNPVSASRFLMDAVGGLGEIAAVYGRPRRGGNLGQLSRTRVCGKERHT